MARAVTLGRLVENTDPGLVGFFPRFSRCAARDRDRARPGEAPKIVQAGCKHAQAVAPEDIDTAPRRRRQLAVQANPLEPADGWSVEPARTGHDQRQLL